MSTRRWRLTNGGWLTIDDRDASSRHGVELALIRECPERDVAGHVVVRARLDDSVRSPPRPPRRVLVVMFARAAEALGDEPGVRALLLLVGTTQIDLDVRDAAFLHDELDREVTV